MKRFLIILLQCTWGLPQTLVGLIVYTICRIQGCERFVLGSCVCTEWRRMDGVSLGLFIFCPKNGGIHLHEYGHTRQSLMLGPLYLAAVSLPSLLWAGLPVFTKMRREKGVPYSRLFCEGWADRIGAGYFYSPLTRTLTKKPKKPRPSIGKREERGK